VPISGEKGSSAQSTQAQQCQRHYLRPRVQTRATLRASFACFVTYLLMGGVRVVVGSSAVGAKESASRKAKKFEFRASVWSRDPDFRLDPDPVAPLQPHQLYPKFLPLSNKFYHPRPSHVKTLRLSVYHFVRGLERISKPSS